MNPISYTPTVQRPAREHTRSKTQRIDSELPRKSPAPGSGKTKRDPMKPTPPDAPRDATTLLF